MKYLLINKGKGTYGLGQTQITLADLINLNPQELPLPTLDQILLNSPSTVYPIEYQPAIVDAQGATLGQVKQLIEESIFDTVLDNKVQTVYVNPSSLSGVGTLTYQIVEYINSNVSIVSDLETSKINIILGIEPSSGFPLTFPITLL